MSGRSRAKTYGSAVCTIFQTFAGCKIREGISSLRGGSTSRAKQGLGADCRKRPLVPRMIEAILPLRRKVNARFSYTRMGRDNARGGQRALLTGRAHLSNLLPYQCRAQHAGHCSVAVEGGRVPTADGLLHLHILTSGGFRCAVPRSTTQSASRWKNLLAASLPLVYENIWVPVPPCQGSCCPQDSVSPRV
jgi:hypothetical protein